MDSKNFLLVAAIDFGTTYSGYAFSFRHDFQRDPTKVSSRNWYAGSGNLLSHKTSSCILFKPNKEFDSFGFKAEDKYFELAEEENHVGWHFFRRFKMQLYNAKNIHKNFPIESDNGTTLPAITVFSESIRYLKQAMLDNCMQQNSDLDMDDIKWVLTVPAIWSDPAKSFMRAAAEEAGIPEERLVIALEPEAAAMFVKELPTWKKKEGGLGDSFRTFGPDSRYLVLDAGGGTVDIAVHEVRCDGTVREVIAANGGNWGGTMVDKSFREFLDQIIGQDVMEEFSKVARSDYLEMFRDFEVKKRLITSTTDTKIVIKISAHLNEIFTNMNPGVTMKDKAASHRFSQHISFLSDKIRIKPIVAMSFFDESINANIDHLERLLETTEVQDTESILMVGGYSESSLLIERVRAVAKGKRLIVPQEAGLVVLKGALLFGHDPSLIAERKSKYTYGVDCSEIFDETKHDGKYKYVDAMGTVRCDKIFSKHVEEGESVCVGVYQSSVVYNPVISTFTFKIFASSNPNPFYVTDEGCTSLGDMSIELPYQDINFGDDQITMKFCFSGTEIEVKAIDKRTGATFLKHIEIPK